MALIAEDLKTNEFKHIKRFGIFEKEYESDNRSFNFRYDENIVQTKYNVFESDNHRIFLSVRDSIVSQYNELREYHNNISLGRVLSNALKTLNKILNLNPLAVSCELTYENSILFTFIIDEFTFYLQQNLILENDEYEEIMLSVFKNEENFPNYAGSFEYIFDTIYSYSPLIYTSY